MAEPKGAESAEQFAKMVVQAVEDDHLLSRDALPVFITSELLARDSAIASAARLEGERAGYARALDAVRDGLQNGVNPSDLIPMLRSRLTDTGGSDAL